MAIEFVLVDDAFPAIFLPHDVDDEAAFLEKAQHLVKGRGLHVSFGETARDDHHIVRLYVFLRRGGEDSSEVACALVALWVTSRSPALDESFQRRLECSTMRSGSRRGCLVNPEKNS